MKKSPSGRRVSTARIYYGRDEEGEPLYWTIKVRDAKKRVKVNGSLADAMSGSPGTTIGCHLSVCCKRNAREFEQQAGHSCKLASFTADTAIIIDKIKNGHPVSGVRYGHNYGQIVKLNDTDPKKEYLKENPSLAERIFTLRPPRKRVIPGTHGKSQNSSRGGSRRQVVPRGALKRAVDAGLVSPGLMSAIS